MLNIDNELKLGTGQFSRHPPKYNGFIPSIKTATAAFE
jgi:hypothetical protein